MAILFYIGRREEEISIIDDLFNVEKIQERPKYYRFKRSIVMISQVNKG